MRTFVIALVFSLAGTSAAVVGWACDSASGSDSTTFILRDGSTTRMIGSLSDLKQLKSKLRGHASAIFVRLDGKEYVIDDAAIVDRAHAIFLRDKPLDEKQEALERDMDALEKRQNALEEREDAAEDEGVERDDAAHAQLDAEERALDRREDEMDAALDEASKRMERDLEELARDAIRMGKAH